MPNKVTDTTTDDTQVQPETPNWPAKVYDPSAHTESRSPAAESVKILGDIFEPPQQETPPLTLHIVGIPATPQADASAFEKLGELRTQAAKLEELSSATASQQPYRATSAMENEFQQGIEQVAARTVVLGLTYTEHRLMKELHKLSKYVFDTQERRSTRQFPTTAVAENNTEEHYRIALRYYTVAMCDFLSETDGLFDADGRLRQPWYRDSLRTGRIVTLAERRTVAADAFNFLHTRNNKVAPDALTYDFGVSIKE